MLIRRIIRPSSLIFSRISISILYVFGVSPSRPQMMLIPGRSLGIPLGPLSDPTLLMSLTASRTCSDVLLRLFSITTSGSADSIPSASTFPSVQLSAIILRISSDSSGYVEMTAGLALSTWIVSNPMAFRPSNSFLTAAGFGLGVSESSSDPYDTMQVCPPILMFLTPRSLSFRASARISSGERISGFPFIGSMQ